MQAIAKTYSPDARQWAARLHHRRMPGVRRWGPQRLAWAHSITGRFARSAVPARGIERTLLRRWWLWMRHFQQFAPQIQVAWQTSMAASWQGHGRILNMPLPPAPSERTTLLRALLSREYHTQSTTFLRTGFLRHSTQSLERIETRHSPATIVIQPAEASSSRSLSDAGAVAAIRRTSTGDAEPLPLVKRVLLQNRRIEEPVAPSRTVLLRRSHPPAPEAHFFESAPPQQMRPVNTNTAWAPNPIQSGFNINQITDEVVRQLDSRLIAARERFGKI